jgi:hypothetical protein
MSALGVPSVAKCLVVCAHVSCEHKAGVHLKCERADTLIIRQRPNILIVIELRLLSRGSAATRTHMTSLHARVLVATRTHMTSLHARVLVATRTHMTSLRARVLVHDVTYLSLRRCSRPCTRRKCCPSCRAASSITSRSLLSTLGPKPWLGFRTIAGDLPSHHCSHCVHVTSHQCSHIVST